MSDIIDDLSAPTLRVLAKKSINEIACLRAENERLREALRGVIRVADRNTAEFNEARAALGGSDG